VHVYNSDNPVIIWSSSFVTVTGSVWSRTGSRGRYDCHHAVNVTLSQDVLVADWKVPMYCYHDLTVYAWNNGVVFTNGSGTDLNLDHHRVFPYATLWSDIDVGKGARVWVGGGLPTWGPYAAAYTTHYNIWASTGNVSTAPGERAGPLGNWIAIQWGPEQRVQWPQEVASRQGWLREGVIAAAGVVQGQQGQASNNVQVWPVDLHSAMVATRERRFSRLGREQAAEADM